MSPKKAAAVPAAPTPTTTATAAATTATAAAAAATTAAPPASGSPGAAELWTEKYRPKTRKDIIGNPGLADKLFTWLQKWFGHRHAAMREP